VHGTNGNVTLLAFEYIITQYCISRGYILINDDDHLFMPFHELTVELIHHISDSFIQTLMARIIGIYWSG